MNIRFDNEVNMPNDNRVNAMSGSSSAKDINMAKMAPVAEYSKGNAAYAEVYQEKNVANLGSSNVKNAMTQKDYMVFMSNTVSEDDYKKLAENGFEPGSMTPEETVTVVDEIKATMAKSGNVVAGFNDDLDKDKLAEITGSQAYAGQISSELKAAFESYDVPETEANVNEAMAAFNMASQITSLDDNVLKYMTENQREASIENLYLAGHQVAAGMSNAGGYFMDATGYLGKKSDVIRDDSITNQIKNVIEDAGYEASDAYVNDAFKMVDDGMTLTADSFRRYEELKNIDLSMSKQELADKIAMTIKDGGKAKDTNLLVDKSVADRAKEIIEEVNGISDEAVEKVVSQGKPLNIRNLSMAQRTITVGMSITQISITEASSSYRATLSSIRISMTISSTAVLLKNGIDVYNEDLNMLSEELKEAGNRQFEALFGQEYSVDKAELKDLFEEATGKINELKEMPLASIGLMSSRSAFTLNVLYEEGKTLQNRYIEANEKYEPLMTEVRSDLGDNIKKAFGNVQDLLREMNMDISSENERAVRILGYSNQEITEDSVNNVRNIYEKVHNVIAKMTPAKTLDLIRDGINPLQTNLDELEEKLDMNPLDPTKEAERYSHFLYRMERSGKITEDEKESFIGIYRMINAIEKNDGAAIGTLIATNGEINFKNLVSAVRTRQNKGIDTSIDDNFGGLSELKFKDPSITEQIEKAFAGQDIEDTDRYDAIEKEYISEKAKEYRDISLIKEEAENLLNNNNISATIDNLLSAGDITSNRGKIYRDIAKLSEKSTSSKGNVNKNVEKTDENSENVEKQADFTRDALDSLIDKFEDRESAQTAFNDMASGVEAFLNREAIEAGSYLDVKDIVSSMKRMSVISKLAENECYELPAYIDGQLSSVRVNLVHDNGRVPNVNINVQSENFGRVNASFGYVDGKIEGMIICDKQEGLDRLKSIEGDFLGALSDDMDISRVNYFKSSSLDVNYYASRTDKLISKENDASNGIEANEGKDAISSKALYKIAKEFIKTLA